jgi:uncharacterized protein
MNAPLPSVHFVTERLAALESVLRGMEPVAIAVSGGVDSLTLAHVAHETLGRSTAMFHAVSPAVPAEATQRTRELAETRGWDLYVIDAGEFESRDYLRNPLERCFHCKTNLYGAIKTHTSAQILSGTNLDDLGEYRPGLSAAKEYGVRHPFVEAQIDKRGVRAIARQLGLGELAELPASPCLSSRIETGIAIDPAMLNRVHETERLIGRALKPSTVRCRVRAKGVVIELDEASLAALTSERRVELSAAVRSLFHQAGFNYSVEFARYRVGSAFLHGAKDVGQPAERRGVGAPIALAALDHDIKLDLRRSERIGFDEAIFCAGKSLAHINRILEQAHEKSLRLLLTRLSPEQFDALSSEHRSAMDYERVSRTGYFGTPHQATGEPRVAVIAAGTSDVPVSREAARTLGYYGVRDVEINDVGVAGLWRLLERIEEIRRMPVVICVAGMDAALPTVVGGLVGSIVIGVPTSVGYGVASGGQTALNAMLASCAPGLLVTNIDNGYGAACAAIRVMRTLARATK